MRSGDWEPVGRLVVRSAAAPRGAEHDLWVAYLAAGPAAVVSHVSAAWLWDLAPPPPLPTLSVPRGGTSRVERAVVHRPRIPAARVVHRKGLPCTDPLRTLVELAAALPAAELDEAVDRALARRLVSVPALEAEIGRVAGRGRQGPALLRGALGRRGHLGAPAPSVLESNLLRLLDRAGITPLATEVRAGPDGRYRLDCLLAPGVAVEVDGFAYHASPEQKGDDERRRNQLRLEGWVLLVYTWRDVLGDGNRVVSELRAALASAPTAGAGKYRVQASLLDCFAPKLQGEGQ